MANNLGATVAYIDTFGADVVMKTTYCKIVSITVYAEGGAEIAYFKNKHGTPVAIVGGLTALVSHFTPCQPITVEGLTFDETLSTLEANDIVIVHFG